MDGGLVIAQGYQMNRTCQHEGAAVARTGPHRALYSIMPRRSLAIWRNAWPKRRPRYWRSLRQSGVANGKSRRKRCCRAWRKACCMRTMSRACSPGRVTREVETQVKWVGCGQGGANRKQEVVEHIRYQMTAVHRDQGAITAQIATLGWRASATNAPEQRFSLVQAVPRIPAGVSH
jgi:hypothetical protein